MWVSFLFGNWETLPNNTTLVYPLYQVSTLDCRTIPFDQSPESCKIELPIIHGADYVTYQNDKKYTDIYTVHWGASYSNGWDNSVWAHYGTDIATAWWTPLYAIADGIVYSSSYNSSYGHVVKIKFKFWGEILYAVYAHMSERLVETWDYVKAWDLIGKTWNSWNVFGALWWYHVHFEIDKDHNGRPSYVFSSCPSLSKWDYAIIEAWECRMQLFQYTKDPIALLESVKARYPKNVSTSSENKPVISEPSHESQQLSGMQDSLTGTVVSQNEIKEEKPEQWWVISESDQKEVVSQDNLLKIGEKISLDLENIDFHTKEFLSLYDLVIERNFSDEVSLWDDNLFLTISLKNKKTWELYHGTLDYPLIFIASNTNLWIDPVSVTLMVKGNAVVQLSPKKVGTTYLMIMMGTSKLWGMTLLIE